ncbi:MAG: YgaP family membrane protein [Putridiphycobacter sp.]
MKKNMGNVDKIIRLVVAVILAGLFIMGKIEGVLGYIAVSVAAIFVLTSIIGFCPLYTLFGIKTCPTKKD